MKLPVLTAIIIVFIIWLQYEIRKTSGNSRKVSENFWKREQDSNLIRRKDISELDYITLQTDRLPLEDNPDQTANSFRDTILKLCDRKIVNLSGLTNTDLKYQYGAPNLDLLIEYDNNYILLVSNLQKWAERLNLLGYTDNSISVLEYAMLCNTDVTKSYLLLAELYMKQNTPDKIDDLIHRIPDTKIKNKEALISKLEAIKNS